MKMEWFYYKLGELWMLSLDKPTRLRLIAEIMRETCSYRYDAETPKYLDLTLCNHYSHRMLKKTFGILGYEIPKTPDCRQLQAILKK